MCLHITFIWENEDIIILEKIEAVQTYTTKEGKAYWRKEGIVISKVMKSRKDHLLALEEDHLSK